MAIVKWTRNLNRFYPKLEPVHTSKKTLKGALYDANQLYPGIIDYILDEKGHIRKHVQVFIDQDAIRDRQNTTVKIGEDSDIYVMQALSGG